VIDKLQEEMKVIEADRARLVKYKSSKAERLKELEEKVKKIEIFDNIDTDKLLGALHKKTEKLKNLGGLQETFETKLQIAENKRDQVERIWKAKFHDEQVKTQSIVDKMEQMKLELKMLETNDSSVASIWKKKCLDLFEVCQTLKSENEELRGRCKELIEQGISLADAIGNMENTNDQHLGQKTNHLNNSYGTDDNQLHSSIKMGREPKSQSAARPMVSTANTVNF
jgi:hypothetical protein